MRTIGDRCHNRQFIRPLRAAAAILAMVGLGAGLVGCNADSFFDPSKVGYWRQTPTVMPILDRLSVIKLHETGPGYRMHGFPGRIGNEMKMKASNHDLARIIPAKVWVM